MVSRKIQNAVLYCIITISCIIQNANGQHNTITFKHLSTADGLSNFTVLSIAQDHQGFMWFGTMDGLNRYDGKKIKIYREDPDDPYSIGNNFINTLQVSSDSGIWIGTNQGLYYYNFKHDNFEYIPIKAPEGIELKRINIRALLVDGKWMWVGTDQGLFRYELIGNKFSDLNELISELFQPISMVHALNATKDGSVWVGHSRGLARVINHKIEKISYDILSDQQRSVISIEVDSDGRLWLGTAALSNGLIIYDPANESKTPLSKNERYLPHNRVNCLSRFNDGNIWVGTTWGLAIINEETLESTQLFYEKQNPHSISQNSIKQIFQSRNGIIWMGTYSGGVNYFDPRSQLISHVSDKYDEEHAINFNIVSSLFEDKNQNLWIGTEYGGVNIYNKKNKTFDVLKNESNRNSLISDNVKSFVEDENGRLFIATQFGLSIYNPLKDSFFNITKQSGPRGELSFQIVHDLCLDEFGDVWIGTTGAQAHFQKYEVKKDTIIHYYPKERNFPTINSTLVNSMIYDEDNDIVWSGGNNGLAGFNVSKKEYVTDELFRSSASILQNTMINDISLDENGHLWIATFGKGLIVMDTKTYQLETLIKDSRLGESSFYATVCDESGNIWVSTSAYLLKIKPTGSIDNPVHSVDKYGIQEGFPPQQYFKSSAAKGADGTLYFGGDDGYIAFDPDQVKKILFYPKVTIVDILVNGESLEIESSDKHRFYHVASQGDVSLSYNQSRFAVQFIAPNYINQDNTWYQYQLSGIQNTWQDLGNSNTINFANLKSGEYELKLRASSDPEFFIDEYTKITLHIDSPYWATPLAYLIYIIIIMMMLYVFFLISRKWERMGHNLKLEHLEREKEQEFHERRIRFFTDISHELRTPLTLILAPIERLIKSNLGNAKIKNQLMLMLRNGERMLQLVNQLLDLRKLETGHMQLQVAKGDIAHFVREVSLSFREMAESREIEFRFSSLPEKVNAWFDRDKFEIVLYNLLSNALKFTPKTGKISIEITEHDKSNKEEKLIENYITLVISNTGRGIPDDQIDHVFERFYTGNTSSSHKNHGSGVGLEIVKKLIDLHHGKIEVDSSYDRNGEKGITSFSITLKKGSSHFDDKFLLQKFMSSEDINGYQTARDKEVANIDEVVELNENEHDEHEHTILIVEDNHEVRKLIVDIFRHEYHVIEGENGKQGLELTHEKIPDLIITDVMMPEMDGIELCRRIKNNIVTSHIPVIILTARTAVTFKYEGLETGADDYIIKPFNVEDLKVRSKNLIRQRQLLKERFTRESSFLPMDITITSVDDKLMKKVKEYIIENIGTDKLTVEKIADEVGMSRANFYRKIKALTNMSAAEFLKKLKMDHAAQLLKTNKFRVSEVQSIIGISDGDYFRKCFKSQFGMAPKEYIDTYHK